VNIGEEKKVNKFYGIKKNKRRARSKYENGKTKDKNGRRSERYEREMRPDWLECSVPSLPSYFDMKISLNQIDIDTAEDNKGAITPTLLTAHQTAQYGYYVNKYLLYNV
jgi:hypothetical protein